jgi:hypothetical protein
MTLKMMIKKFGCLYGGHLRTEMSLRGTLKDRNVSRAIERRRGSGGGVQVSLGKKSITAYFDKELSRNKVSMKPKITTAMDLDSRDLLGQAWAKFFQANDIAGFKADCPYFRAAMKITQQLGPTHIPECRMMMMMAKVMKQVSRREEIQVKLKRMDQTKLKKR